MWTILYVLRNVRQSQCHEESVWRYVARKLCSCHPGCTQFRSEDVVAVLHFAASDADVATAVSHSCCTISADEQDNYRQSAFVQFLS